MPRNADLLREVATRITLYPEHHDQRDFFANFTAPAVTSTLSSGHTSIFDSGTLFPSEDDVLNCGATCCAAGWAITLAIPGYRRNGESLTRLAGDLLGLTEDEAIFLFVSVMNNEAVPKILHALADGATLDDCEHILSLYEDPA